MSSRELDRAGWFGSQLGGTLWIAVGGALALGRDLRTGLVVLGLFVAANALGWQLWRRRGARPPLASLRRLLLLVGASGCLAVFALERAGLFETIQVGGAVTAELTYALIVGLTALLWIVFARQFGSDGGDQSSTSR